MRAASENLSRGGGHPLPGPLANPAGSVAGKESGLRLQVLRSAERSIGLFSALTLDRSRSCEGRRSLAV